MVIRMHGGHIPRTVIGILALVIVMAAYTGVVGAQGMDVTLNPTEGAPGTQVTANGSNWPAGHTIHVLWDGNQSQDINQTTVDSNGNFITTFLVPSYAGQGQHNILFWDEQGRTFSPPKLFTVTQPTSTPTSTFNISGFKINNATSEGIQGWNITLSNDTMQTSMLTVADGSYIFMNLANGTYNVAEEMQDGWTSVSPISQQVTINGADIMNVNFTNQPPSPTVTPVLTTITVSPSTAMLNVTETQPFTATALDQNNTPMSGINISWTISNSTVGSVTPLFAVTGMDGKASTTFTASAAGTTTVTATNGTVSGSSDVTVAAVTPTPIPPTPVPITPIPPVLGLKTQPTVILIPPSGKVGDWTQGLGIGWPPLQRVDVFWDGNSFASKQVASNVPTNGNGGFIAYFKVPEGAAPGSHDVRFTMQGMEPPITVDKTFQVRSTISPVVPTTPTQPGQAFDLRLLPEVRRTLDMIPDILKAVPGALKQWRDQACVQFPDLDICKSK